MKNNLVKYLGKIAGNMKIKIFLKKKIAKI